MESRIVTSGVELPQLDTLTEVVTETDFLEESFVYVHCSLPHTEPGMLVRIWKTTYLHDCDSPAKAELVHVENISYAPQWTLVGNASNYSFLLIFTALPKSCARFDLVEEIAQPGGFHVSNIGRNKTDVYRVVLNG